MGDEPRLMRVVTKGEQLEGYAFWCPGCDCLHKFTTNRPEGDPRDVWTFNGSMDKPTFRASLMVQWGRTDADGNPAGRSVCHLFMTDGMIQFLGDCTHALAGQTVPMVPLPERLR